MIYEQWNSIVGTSGINGWAFAGDIVPATPILGTGVYKDGTSALTGWGTSTVGRCYIGSAATLEATTYRWKCYSRGGSVVYMLLAQNAGGTSLGYACTAGGNGGLWSEWVGTAQTHYVSSIGTDMGPAWADVVVNYDGDGTWSGTNYTADGGTKTHIYGSAFVPVGSMAPEFRSGSNNAVGTTGITDVEYPVTAAKSRFDYFGTFNNGLNWGWLNLGEYVMSIGPVQERLYEPNTTRGWMSQTSVVMDDTYNRWNFWLAAESMLSKYRNQGWPQGTFHVRQTWDDGSTYTDLITGYSSPDLVSYDSGEKIVTIPVNSMLGKFAQYTIPYDQQLIGTVSDITDGTVTVSGTGSHWNLYEREHIWPSTGTDDPSIRIASLPDGGTWDGTGPYSAKFYLSETPSWLVPNASIYRSQSGDRWVNGYPTIAEVLNAMGMTGGLDFDDTQWFGMYVFGTEMVRYYGGERWLDVLYDICSATGAAFTMLPNAGGRTWFTKWFMPKPELGSPSGTLDRDTALNDTYGIRYSKAYDKCIVNGAWDPDEERMDAQASRGIDGNTLNIEAKWLRSDRYCNALAGRTLALGVTNRLTTLTFEGSTWNDIQVGEYYTNYGAVVARTYRPDVDLVDYELMDVATKNIITVGTSTCGGNDEVW